MKLYFAAPLPTTAERAWNAEVVAARDRQEPDSGTCWEVGYAYGSRKPTMLVRTHFRHVGTIGRYNPMVAESATVRLDLPAACTTTVIAAILEGLSTIEREGRGRR